MFEYRGDRETERKVSVEKEVLVPAEAIFALLADPTKHPLLDGSSTVGPREWAGRRLELGSRFAMQMRRGRIRYRVVSTVVEHDEGRLIAWRHLSGHRWIWQLEPLADGRALVRETFDWSSARTPRLIELLGYPERNRAAMAASLERIEHLVALHEASADESPNPGAASAGERSSRPADPSGRAAAVDGAAASGRS